MWFRLARQLGMSVWRAQQEISSTEFAEWLAFETIEPGDPIRGDVRSALLASVFANAFRDTKRKPQAFTIKDFLIRFDRDEEKLVQRQSQKEIRTRLEMFKSLHMQALRKQPKKGKSK